MRMIGLEWVDARLGVSARATCGRYVRHTTTWASMEGAGT